MEGVDASLDVELKELNNLARIHHAKAQSFGEILGCCSINPSLTENPEQHILFGAGMKLGGPKSSFSSHLGGPNMLTLLLCPSSMMGRVPNSN